METDNTDNRAYEWTREGADRFWSRVADSRLAELSFCRLHRDAIAAFIGRLAAPPARVLDFGSGDGDLAEALLDAGYAVALHEPAASRRDRAALKRLAGRDGFLGYAAPGDGRDYDVVCAFEVLEHLLPEEVDGALSFLAEALAGNGVLIGTVPLEEEPLREHCLCPSCGTEFHRWQHMRSFDNESLRAFLAPGGFETAAFITEFSLRLGFVAAKGALPTLPDLPLDGPESAMDLLARAEEEAHQAHNQLGVANNNLAALDYRMHLTQRELAETCRILAAGGRIDDSPELRDAVGLAMEAAESQYPVHRQLADARNDLAEACRRLAVARAEALDQRGLVERTERSRRDEFARSAGLERQNHDLQREVAEASGTNHLLRDRVARLEAETAQAAGLEESLRAENGDLRRRGEELAAENGRLASEVKRLGAEGDRLRSDCDGLETERERLENETERLRGREEELTGQAEEDRKTIIALKNTVAFLEDERKAARLERAGLLDSRREADAERERLLERADGLEDEKRRALETIADMTREISVGSDLLARAKEEAAARRQEGEIHRSRADEKEKTLRLKELRLADAESEAAALRSRLAATEAEAAALRPYREMASRLGDDNLASLSRFGFLSRRIAGLMRLASRVPGLTAAYQGLGALRGFPYAPSLRGNVKAALAPVLSAPGAGREQGIASPDFDRLPPPRRPSRAAGRGLPSVCFVTGTLGPGGAERQIANLAVLLHRRGHAVRVRAFNLEGQASHYAPLLLDNGVDLRPIPGFSPTAALRLLSHGISADILSFIPPGELRGVMALADDLLRHPVDVVHGYLDQPGIAAAWAGLLSGTPVMRISWRNVNPTNFVFYQDWMPEQYSFLLDHPRVTVESNSRYAAGDYAEWLGIDPASVLVSPNGISRDWSANLEGGEGKAVRASLGIPENAPVVLCPCRLDEEKRPGDIIAVFETILAASPKAWCLHAGAGRLAGEAAKAVDGLESALRNRVRLLGARDDMPALYAAADIVLLCSAAEGMPNAVMEAMHMGLPAVTTDVGGCPELVTEGETGFMFRPGDVNGLAAGCLRLIREPALRAKLGKAAKKRIASFSLEALADRAVASYRRDLEGVTPGRPRPGPGKAYRALRDNLRYHRRAVQTSAAAVLPGKESQYALLRPEQMEEQVEHLVELLDNWRTVFDAILPNNCRALELGPGADFILALHLQQKGAEVTVADPYLCGWQPQYHPRLYGKLLQRLPDFTVLETLRRQKGFGTGHYRHNAGAEHLDFATDGVYTLVYSNAVCEHLRDPAAALRELYRVSAPGCRHFHQIDLRHHEDMERSLEHLLLSRREFAERRLRVNCENGCQWRLAEWLDMIADAGFHNIRTRPQYLSTNGEYFADFLSRLRQSDSAYRDWPEDDLRVDSVFISFEKPLPQDNEVAPAARASRPVCSRPWQQMTVGIDGSVTPCCNWREGAFLPEPLGNANAESLETIWNGPGYRRLRERFTRGDLDGLNCRSCLQYMFNGNRYPEFRWPGMFSLENGLCWIGRIPPNVLLAAQAAGQPILMTENGVPLPEPDALHADIRASGGGRYSIWGAYAYFSSTDNTSPMLNGRAYAFRCDGADYPFTGMVADCPSGKNALLGWEGFRAGRGEVAAKPMILAVATATECNIDCQSCSQNRPRMMNIGLRDGVEQEILDLVPTLVELAWNGGEPLVMPDFRRFLKNFDRAVNPNLALIANTNGVLLDSDALNRFRAFPSATIEISMDSFERATFERIRTGADHATVMRNMHDAVQASDSSLSAFVSILVQKDNILELPAIVTYAAEHDIPVSFSMLLAHPLHKRLDMYGDPAAETAGWLDAIDRALAAAAPAGRDGRPCVRYHDVGTALQGVRNVVTAALERYIDAEEFRFSLVDPTALANLPCPGLVVGGYSGRAAMPYRLRERLREPRFEPVSLDNPLAYTLLDSGQTSYVVRLPRRGQPGGPLFMALVADMFSPEIPLLMDTLRDNAVFDVPRATVLNQAAHRRRFGGKANRRMAPPSCDSDDYAAWYAEKLRESHIFDTTP